ncbi:response regulator transcription factor [Treponema zuelzerae]|uniref:Response regulator transcription factor n=1 Tax=Teretinema zuelzerae TaxID=156 RepID=A0AAE3EKA5_9SPIR|nr:response regulator transcription factor [Teretinema zuelzerae]MCD1655039.1 response regulator transcription factor [Teretinema zuelzerae]
MPRSSIIIVDDHPIFSKGLAQLLGSENLYDVSGTATDCAGALALVRDANPDLAIVDLNLGDEDGINLIKDIKLVKKDIKILVLSMHDERYYAERALRQGARGYIMKDENVSNVLEAIRTILAGKIWLSAAGRERLFEYMSNCDSSQNVENRFASVNSLSNRQLQIFRMIGKGLGTADIAARLSLSPKTVDTHKEHIKLKLHCNTSQELRQLAIERGGD